MNGGPARGGVRRVTFVVEPADAGRRLDQVLAARVPGLSRGRARVLLDLGGVFVDRRRVKVASRAVRPGQTVLVHLGGVLERATGTAGRPPDEGGWTVVFEDAAIVVVEKPAGLLAAPTPESDRGNLFEGLRRDGRPDLWLVHRLDRETSGLVVFAKTPAANAGLAEQFRTHSVERAYEAVLHGVITGPSRTVEEPIGGRRAVTHFHDWRPCGDAATLVRARLETGRTHQIRIHAKHLGHPVLGDRTHGVRTPIDPPRMALHAMVLGIVHPTSRETMRWERPWPTDLVPWLGTIGAPT